MSALGPWAKYDATKAPRALVVLQVRPRGAGPPFWAHRRAMPGHPIEFEWNTIMAEVATKLSRKKDREVLVQLSGTKLGTDVDHAIEWQYVGDVIDAWFDNDPESPFTWEFQLLPTGTYGE